MENKEMLDRLTTQEKVVYNIYVEVCRKTNSTNFLVMATFATLIFWSIHLIGGLSGSAFFVFIIIGFLVSFVAYLYMCLDDARRIKKWIKKCIQDRGLKFL